MKTFNEWTRAHGYASLVDVRIDGYLDYALDYIKAELLAKTRHESRVTEQTADALFNMARKITDPPLFHSDGLDVRPYGTQIDSAYSKGLNEGLNKVKRDAKQTEELEYEHGQTDGYTRGYRLGMADDRKDKKDAYDRGHKAGKKLGFGGVGYGERAISTREFDRLVRQDKDAKDAFDRGYVEANRQYRYARTTPKIEKAARECAMTWMDTKYSASIAINNLRNALNITLNDVALHNNKNRVKL